MPIEALLKSSQGKAAVTGLLSGAAGGALAGSLTKSKSAKKMLKAGGLLAVGGLAMKAWQMHSDKQNNPQAPAEPAGFEPTAFTQNQSSQHSVQHISPPVAPQAGTTGNAPIEENEHQHREASLILSAMISAAHADGILTSQEQQAIWSKAVELNLPAEDLAALSQALSNPLNVEQIASQTATMEEKIEVFTASALVIGNECNDGEVYLTNLGSTLGLPEGLCLALKQQVA